MNTVADMGIGSSAQVVGPNPGAPERWEIDESRSRLSFTLTHLVVKKIHGEFETWGGTLFLDPRQQSLSSLRVWVELNSVDTDAPERNTHIRSSEFFDVAQFRLATFKSTTVDEREGVFVVNGRLDLHGAIRDVELTATPLAMPTSAEQRKSFSVSAKIDRQAFGLHWNQDLDAGGMVVGDSVELEAHVEVVRSTDDT
jgi:polyisoprenoid-binding protein YceI